MSTTNPGNRLPKRQSLRLAHYDYAAPGAYFITICTQERRCLFGEAINGAMLPNTLGHIVMSCWADLPNHYPNVLLDGFILMPNHVHGLLFIEEPFASPADHVSRRVQHAVSRAPSPSADDDSKPITIYLASEW